jgi:hypothetical protein
MKIQITDNETMKRAAKRARACKPLVQVIRFREYLVTNRASKAAYSVTFSVIAGRKFSECTCRAGLNGLVCYHVAAAASRHLICAAEIAAAQTAAAPAPLITARDMDESILVKPSAAAPAKYRGVEL